ncbi:MAG: hypothetical protein KDD67_08435 [Ignavibacteriae bacterium]|nr:hypothetical protein [Ignavibacteriota bacterium]MCB9216694.1 hypothetical protein [Ignavibacteria bacterium]
MKRHTLTILLFAAATNFSCGQTIQEIFKSLPSEYSLELTVEAKDSLMQYGTYTFPGGDSIETVQCDYHTEKDFIEIVLSFTTGQRAFAVIQLKKFQKIDGSIVVVYAKYGGLPAAFDQHSLLTFDYVDDSLKRNEHLGLPETIETSEFLKEDLPDSVEADKITFNTSYDVNPLEANSIEYLIDPQTSQFDDWIKTNRFSFRWNGETFEKMKE